MQLSFSRRLTLITFVLVVTGVLLLARLASFQFQFDVANYLRNIAARKYYQIANEQPPRGNIYDRNGELLAGNTTEYKIGVSPIYITDPEKSSRDVADLLGDDPARLYTLMTSEKPFELITTRPVSTETAQKVAALELLGIVIEPEPRRVYPHNSLAAHLLGFVGWDGTVRRGYVGVEGNYNDDLAGQVMYTEESRIPFEANTNNTPPPGRDIYLTLDRSIQYLAEQELATAISQYGATSGSILIMDPRTGEILGMASLPTFDPNKYYDVKPGEIPNPVISSVYEPGSVFKVVTAALALRTGDITPDWTYMDVQVRNVGGANIYNWDRGGHGSQTFDDILIHSWNIGTTHLSVDVLGKDDFYAGLRDFGLGARTGIDLEGEEAGIVKDPGFSRYWSDSDLATNSFGQGISVTPLQMLCYVNTIANGGLMMQPHIRLMTADGNRQIKAQPVAVRQPITPDVSRRITDIMTKVVSIGEGRDAAIPGYTVAGKTGTAQIPLPTGGYDETLQNATFVGFFPADEPRVSILIKLDNVSLYASQTAAPAFGKIGARLAVIMNIPTDVQRAELRAQGGNTSMITFR